MPYIVTTKQEHLDGWKPLSRHAVATLFEAREEAAHRIEKITGGDPDYEEMYTDAQGCSELGETFGPLQGGSTVEVKRVGYFDLADATDVPKEPRSTNDGRIVMRPASHVTDAQIIDAFNAR